jgi:hypothetical protein
MNELIRALELKAIAYADSQVPAAQRYNDIYYNVVCGKLGELVWAEAYQQGFADGLRVPGNQGVGAE